MKPYDKQLVLENGKQFFGYGFGECLVNAFIEAGKK